MNQRPRTSGGGRPGGRSAKPKKRIDVKDLDPVDEVPDIETFTEWELGDEIQGSIRDMGITKPTPIQAISIGLVLEGKDVIAKAETGTGKTLAFGAPMIARMDPERSTVLGMVLCPTRELAQQVAEVLEALGKARGLTVALLVGGDKIDPQIRALKAGAQVIVGTPGRVLDLYNQRFLQFPWTETVVLDEADKMFEIGFIDDIRKILSFTPEERQTLLFSATFPPEVLLLAREQTTNPSEIATAKGTSTVTNIDQIFIPMSEDDCPMALMRMLEQSAKEEVFLVFCERRTDVDKLLRRFERLPFMVKALHGGYDQAARFRVMTAFRTGEVKALIATDVAARGLDVNHVTHVINFAVPRELEDYTHRIGRTGRAGRDGTAITFVTPRDSRRWREMTSGVDWEIREGELPRRGRPDHSRDRGSRQDERPRGRQREEQRPAREESRPRREERDERPVRREREESRPRREEGDKSPRGRQREEQRPAREESRPRREERDERPVRREREESRPRREEGDKSPRGRQREEERPTRRDREESRPRREEGDKSPRGRQREEERPTRRDREESRPRREEGDKSPRGRQREEERPARRDREESRPSREREESRPRREEGDKSPRGRQREEERPARRDREESRPSREREESRPRREERDERPRGRQREETRPRREERDERPRGRQREEERPARREREEQPRRQRAESEAPKQETADSGGFGWLPPVEEKKSASKPRSAEPAKAREPKPKRENAPAPEQTPSPSSSDLTDTSSGFGAGI